MVHSSVTICANHECFAPSPPTPTPHTPSTTTTRSSQAQLKLHLNIGMFKEVYNSDLPCPPQVTQFLFKVWLPPAASWREIHFDCEICVYADTVKCSLFCAVDSPPAFVRWCQSTMNGLFPKRYFRLSLTLPALLLVRLVSVPSHPRF